MDNELFINSQNLIFDKGYYGKRFSEEQYKYLKEESEHFRIRSLCSPNIFLKFRKINNIATRFHFNIEEFARDTVHADIYKDNKFVQHLEFPNRSNSIDIIFNESFENSIIDLYLSNTCTWKLTKIEGSYEILPKMTQKKLLILGDSISQGMETVFPSLTYSHILSRRFNLEVINQSCGGIGFDKNIISMCDIDQPDYVLVALGTNDIMSEQNLDQCINNINEVLELITARFIDSIIILISPIHILDKNVIKKRYEAVRQTINSFASKKSDIILLDGKSIFPRNEKFYYDKTIHPNDEGNFLIYLELEKIFRRKENEKI